MQPSPIRLSLRNIVKRYPGVLAVDDVSLDVAPGEIHAVLGENGAGKSTLMKVIYGAVRPDSGSISWDGKEVAIASPADARKLGVAMVFQHFALFESITVVENVIVAMPQKESMRELADRIAAVSERYGLQVNPWRPVHELSVGERQRAEIVRCLLQTPRLLIMDEPTSVLIPQAVDQLFETLRALRDEGTSILYVSHKMDEIRRLCDRATILRNGRFVEEVDPRSETEASLARRMIGRDFPETARREHAFGDVVLEVAGLSLVSEDPYGTSLKDVSFRLHAGEILGIAGISGNGQAELLAAISGEQPVVDRNAIFLGSAAVGDLGAAKRRALGLAYVPEDRLGIGAVPPMSLTENALLTAHRESMVNSGLVSFARAESYAEACISSFNVKCSGSNAAARSLSGGNLQKFILGREIGQHPRVMVLAQPTWGVDVAASAAIRQAVIDLAAKGVAVLVVSEELSEILEICDRVVVIAGGRLSPVRDVADTDSSEIGQWMAGMFPGLATTTVQEAAP
jgi:general nucleoside transport system ATP-binding protein